MEISALFPGAHYAIGYPRRCAGYFEQAAQPPFQDNTQLSTERMGGMRMPLRIDFLKPEKFGFCLRSRGCVQRADLAYGNGAHFSPDKRRTFPYQQVLAWQNDESHFAQADD